MRRPQVKDYMTTNVVTLHEKDSVLEACKIIDENSFRHLPIVDYNKHILGIISDRDLVSFNVFSGISNSLEQSKQDLPAIELFMRRSLFVIMPDDDLATAGILMNQNKIGALPVIDELAHNKLVGILSYVDILRAYIDFCGERPAAVSRRMPIFEEKLINSWQEQLGFEFPAGYKEALLSGDDPINTLNYCIPYENRRFNELIVFAFWNDQTFAFKRNEKGIYQLSNADQPEKCCDDFNAWQKLVHKAAESAYFEG